MEERLKDKRLSRPVIMFLVILGSCVPSEGVFSDAGYVVTKHGSRLREENLLRSSFLKSAFEGD